MGRPRLGEKLKTRIDYSYDFPHQREIASMLTTSDITILTERLKIRRDTIYSWCEGKHRSLRTENLAKLLAEANKKKLDMVEQMCSDN